MATSTMPASVGTAAEPAGRGSTAPTHPAPTTPTVQHANNPDQGGPQKGLSVSRFRSTAAS
jgi:hypothetical protein